MKYLLYLIVVPLILTLSYGGCSSGGGDDDFECVSKESIVDSECIAEDLLNVCEQFFCGATFPPIDDGPGLSADFHFPPMDQECISIDCNTLDCQTFGLFSEIEIGMNGRPTGLLDKNPEIDTDPVVEFVCFGSQ